MKKLQIFETTTLLLDQGTLSPPPSLSSPLLITSPSFFSEVKAPVEKFQPPPLHAQTVLMVVEYLKVGFGFGFDFGFGFGLVLELIFFLFFFFFSFFLFFFFRKLLLNNMDYFVLMEI